MHARSGIDWVTWSEKVHDGEPVVHQLAEDLLHHQAERGCKVEPWGMEGYKGWKAEGIAIGSRRDGVLLRLSGSLADSSWTRLRSSPGKPTRLDVQTTFKLARPLTSFGTHIIKPATKARNRSRGGQQKTSILKASDGAWCGSVGSRISRSYVRVYDKGVEQKSHVAGLLWRYELEAKRDLAPKLWQELIKAEEPEKWCYQSCVRSSVRSGLRWPSGINFAVLPMPKADQVTPAELTRAMMWLENTVQPTVKRVLREKSVAHVLELLGLSELAAPISQEPQPPNEHE